MAKEGSTVGGLMDSFGTAVSMSLQYGVPLEVYVNKFSHTRFEPMGHTKNPDIRLAKSIVDYIFRWLGITFLPGYREANANMGHTETAGPTGEDGAGDTKPTARMSGGPNAGAGSPKASEATKGRRSHQQEIGEKNQLGTDTVRCRSRTSTVTAMGTATATRAGRCCSNEPTSTWGWATPRSGASSLPAFRRTLPAAITAAPSRSVRRQPLSMSQLR